MNKKTSSKSLYNVIKVNLSWGVENLLMSKYKEITMRLYTKILFGFVIVGTYWRQIELTLKPRVSLWNFTTRPVTSRIREDVSLTNSWLIYRYIRNPLYNISVLFLNFLERLEKTSTKRTSWYDTELYKLRIYRLPYFIRTRL